LCGLRVNPVFHGLHSFLELLGRFSGINGDTAGQNSRSAVQFVGNKVNGTAVM